MRTVLASIVIGIVLIGGTGLVMFMPSTYLGKASTVPSGVSSDPTLKSSGSLVVGSPEWQFLSFNYSGVEVKFIPYETFPVTVYSAKPSDVSLDSSAAPPGVWIHYASDSVQAGPQGTITQLVVAGAVKPFAGPGDFNITLATSASPTNTTTLPLAEIGIPVTVISDQVSNLVPSSIEVPANASEPYVFGIAYGPSQSSSQAYTVNLQILGVSVDGSVQPLPAWLKLSFSSDSISLNPDLPTYLALDEANSASLPLAQTGGVQQTITMTLAIAETIGGISHTQLSTLTILPEVQT